MIGLLRGVVIDHFQDDGGVIIDCQGVGYEVFFAKNAVEQLQRNGKNITVYIYTHLRENSLELFGFHSLWEKNVFLLLISMNGIGPKTALGILSHAQAELILSAISRQDILGLTRIPGIGKKTAERLVVELADKARKMLASRTSKPTSLVVENQETASSVAEPTVNDKTGSKKMSKKSVAPNEITLKQSLDLADVWNEALSALENLGYADVHAFDAVKRISDECSRLSEPVSVEILIKGALKVLARPAAGVRTNA